MGEGVRGIAAISRSNYRAAGELGHSDGCGPGCQLLRGQESSHCGPVKERLADGWQRPLVSPRAKRSEGKHKGALEGGVWVTYRDAAGVGERGRSGVRRPGRLLLCERRPSFLVERRTRPSTLQVEASQRAVSPHGTDEKTECGAGERAQGTALIVHLLFLTIDLVWCTTP